MNDLLQAYGTDSDSEHSQDDQQDRKEDVMSNSKGQQVQNGLTNGQVNNGQGSKQQLDGKVGNTSSQSQVELQKQSRPQGLLGKRSAPGLTVGLLGNKGRSDEDQEEEEEEFDLMKKARKQIEIRNKQEQVLRREQEKLRDMGKGQEELHLQKLQNIDPSAQKLFEMLPAPKNSADLSISRAIRSNVDINYVPIVNPSSALNDQDENPSDTDDFQQPSTLGKKSKFVDLSSTDLINKEEFYRNQLKKHSINAFRGETLERMRGTYDQVGALAAKGKNKNHLTTLASDHLDLITRIEDDKNSNLQEFRQKRARYGW